MCGVWALPCHATTNHPFFSGPSFVSLTGCQMQVAPGVIRLGRDGTGQC